MASLPDEATNLGLGSPSDVFSPTSLTDMQSIPFTPPHPRTGPHALWPDGNNPQQQHPQISLLSAMEAEHVNSFHEDSQTISTDPLSHQAPKNTAPPLLVVPTTKTKDLGDQDSSAVDGRTISDYKVPFPSDTDHESESTHYLNETDRHNTQLVENHPVSPIPSVRIFLLFTAAGMGFSAWEVAKAIENANKWQQMDSLEQFENTLLVSEDAIALMLLALCVIWLLNRQDKKALDADVYAENKEDNESDDGLSYYLTSPSSINRFTGGGIFFPILVVGITLVTPAATHAIYNSAEWDTMSDLERLENVVMIGKEALACIALGLLVVVLLHYQQPRTTATENNSVFTPAKNCTNQDLIPSDSSNSSEIIGQYRGPLPRPLYA